MFDSEDEIDIVILQADGGGGHFTDGEGGDDD